MPTYEYLCQSCGHRFETWQKMSDDPLETCPVCGQHIRRVIYPVGLVFKGSGFYSTDNRGKSAAVPAGEPEKVPAATSGDAASSASASGSAEAKTSATEAKNGASSVKASASTSAKPAAAAASE